MEARAAARQDKLIHHTHTHGPAACVVHFFSLCAFVVLFLNRCLLFKKLKVESELTIADTTGHAQLYQEQYCFTITIVVHLD